MAATAPSRGEGPPTTAARSTGSIHLKIAELLESRVRTQVTVRQQMDTEAQRHRLHVSDPALRSLSYSVQSTTSDAGADERVALARPSEHAGFHIDPEARSVPQIEG
jgi:hypothetical protein